MKIVSFNLRCVYAGDGINAFPNRAASILLKIESEQPDVICFQEAMPHNIEFLEKHLTDYTVIYNQRLKDFSGEGLAFALKNGSVSLYGLEFFWLSDTPYLPGSRFKNQSECPRITQSVLIKDMAKSKLFRVYNNHLDHISDEARILGIKQVVRRIKQDRQKMDLPFFVLGDFNAIPNSDTIKYCRLQKDVPMADLTENTGGTFHNFGKIEPEKIDYIFADAKTAQKKYSVKLWDGNTNGVFLSDHYPVEVDIDF